MWGKMVYREITPPEKLVWVNSFSDENAGITRHPMAPTWPVQLLTTVTFEELGDKTTITIHWVPINPDALEKKTFEEGFDSMTQGWTGTFDRLEDHIAEQ